MIATDILVDLEESRVLLRVPGKYRMQVNFFNLPTFSHIPMRSYYYQVEAYIYLQCSQQSCPNFRGTLHESLSACDH